MEKSDKSRLLKILLVSVFIILVFFIAILLFWEILKFSAIVKTFNYVVQNIVNISGMSFWLAKGFVILLMIPFFWAVAEIFKFRIKLNVFRKKAIKSYKKIAVLIIVVYIAFFFLGMYFLGQGKYFGHFEGKALKYYAVTPEGIRFFDSPGFDPKYGKELKPATPQMIEQMERAKRGMQPKRIGITGETEFFDSITGQPKVWYFIDSEGNYEFFDQLGYHPVYWEELKPVTKDIIINYKKIAKQKEELKAAKEQEEQEKIRITEAKEKVKKEYETKRAYIERNINVYIRNDPNIIDIGIIIAEKENLNLSQSSSILADKIGDKLSKDGIKVMTNLFKNEFVAGGNFKNLIQGDTRIATELEINNHVDYVIMGLKKASYSQDPNLADLFSCRLDLDLKVISIKTGEIVTSSSFREAGVGIDKEKAEEQAAERIAIKVENFVFSKIK